MIPLGRSIPIMPFPAHPRYCQWRTEEKPGKTAEKEWQQPGVQPGPHWDARIHTNRYTHTHSHSHTAPQAPQKCGNQIEHALSTYTQALDIYSAVMYLLACAISLGPIRPYFILIISEAARPPAPKLKLRCGPKRSKSCVPVMQLKPRLQHH